MDVSKMTLEGFFLADYQRMRDRIAELETELERMKHDKYGCFDQHQKCEAVCISVASGYTYYGYQYKGAGLEDFERALDMTDEDLFAWANKIYKATNSSYTTLRPISITYHTFQYTLKFVESRHESVYVTDGSVGKELCDVDSMEEEMVDNLNHWCRIEYFDQLKKAALDMVRENLRAAIERLEKDSD